MRQCGEGIKHVCDSMVKVTLLLWAITWLLLEILQNNLAQMFSSVRWCVLGVCSSKVKVTFWL